MSNHLNMGSNGHRILGLLLIISFVLLPTSQSITPPWWTSRDVLIAESEANDYAPVTAGQLKWMASMARDELDVGVPGGAGDDVIEMVEGFIQQDNFAPINVGQLKNVALPIYTRLIAVGYTNQYPWTSTITDDADYSPANIGQLKNVFSFDVSTDSDGDGMPDWWEIKHGTDPNNPDTDGDELPDGIDAYPSIFDVTAPVFYISSPTNGWTVN